MSFVLLTLNLLNVSLKRGIEPSDSQFWSQYSAGRRSVWACVPAILPAPPVNPAAPSLLRAGKSTSISLKSSNWTYRSYLKTFISPADYRYRLLQNVSFWTNLPKAGHRLGNRWKLSYILYWTSKFAIIYGVLLIDFHLRQKWRGRVLVKEALHTIRASNPAVLKGIYYGPVYNSLRVDDIS